MNATFQAYADKSAAKRGFGRTFKDFSGDVEDYIGKNADGKWGFNVFSDDNGGKFYRDIEVSDEIPAESEALAQFEAEADFEQNPDAPEYQADAPTADSDLAAAIEKGIAEGESEHTDEDAPEKPSALGSFAFAQLTAPSNATTETEPEQPKEGSGLKIEKNRAESNGVKRPSAGTLCAQVWDTAQALTGKNGKNATLSEVVAACEAKNINKFTARTQYARWRAFNGITGRAAK